MIPQRIVPVRHGDARGWLSETYSRRRLAECGIDVEFVQDNQSFSAQRGTLRGIHFQTPPHAQAKLVRCLAGAIFDVAVDLRTGSPSYGQWVGTTLTAERGEQLYVPAGFGHGFLTLTDDVQVGYKASGYYAPECDAGIAWDDPEIGIIWPLDDTAPVLSAKDRTLPRLRDFASPFVYQGEPMRALD